MKYLLYTIIGCILIFILGISSGLIGIHYPHVVENQPLESPIKVVRIDGQNLTLSDGRVIIINDETGRNWRAVLSESENMIDVEEHDNGFVEVYGRQNGWICGTPWVQPIRIPIIRDTVYKNRRELIAIGKLKKGNSQEDAATDAAKPRR